jgi:ATP-binding cassette subfamily B protein
MAETANRNYFSNPLDRILAIIRHDRNEFSSIYFYAILNGLINLSLPLGIQSIISFVLGGSFSTSLVILIVLVVAGVFLNGMLNVNQMRIIEKIQQKIFVRYSLEFSNRLPRLDLQAVDNYYLPELVNRFFDTVSLQKGISKLLLDIPGATIQILFGLILLAFYHPIFIFFGFALIFIVYLILRLTSGKGMESSLRESDYKYAVAGWLEELARVVHSFKFSANRQLNITKADTFIQGYLKHRTTHFKVLLFQYWSLVGFKLAITAAMLIVGSLLLVNQQLNIGQFIAAEIVILMVIGSVEKLMANLDTVYDVLTSIEKLDKLTEKPLEESGVTLLDRKAEGLSVDLNNVSFSYDPEDTQRPALEHVNLSIRHGEKICIMGLTGSGKSSLLRIISGAYTHFSGTIYINNIPIRNYSTDSLREQTGILLSRLDIFQGSLMENITMGNQDITPHHVLELAEKIGLGKFLTEQASGLNTPIDPIGKKLSRNIRQKILLLRALVHRPRLVLLEEPFEGLGTETIDRIVDYIIGGIPETTVLISTSKEAYASKCDRVVYLENGSITATGKWKDIAHKLNLKIT